MLLTQQHDRNTDKKLIQSTHCIYDSIPFFYIKVRELTDFGAMHLITSLLNSLISQTLLFMVMLTSAENTPPVIVIKHLPVKN